MDPAAFRRLWKELKKLGWKDRAAPGDEVGWLYIRPGKTFKGKRGEDVFVGPDAVLSYVKRANRTGELHIDLASILGVPLHPNRRGRVEYPTPPTTGHIDGIAAASAPVVDNALQPLVEVDERAKPTGSPDSSEHEASTASPEQTAMVPAISQPTPSVPSTPGADGLVPSPSSSPAASGSHGRTPPVSPSASPPASPAASPPASSAPSPPASPPTTPSMTPPSPSRTPPPAREIVEWLADVETSDSSVAWGRSDAESVDEAYLSDLSMSDVNMEELVEDIRELEAEEQQYQQGQAGEDQAGADASEAADSSEFVRLDSSDEGDNFLADGSDSGGEQDELVFDEDQEFDEAPADELRFHAGGADELVAGCISQDKLKSMRWSNPVSYDGEDHLQEPYEPRSKKGLFREYPGLFAGEHGPNKEAFKAASSPLGEFIHFMTPQLWERITVETNAYASEKLEDRVQASLRYQAWRVAKNPRYQPKSEADIRKKLAAIRPVMAIEILKFMGLLIARTIAPNKERLAHHWKIADEGGIPRECVGNVLVRDRFMYIAQNLHFSSNSDPRAKTDRAWKIRPVIEHLQARFVTNYNPPGLVSFDEAMLPSRSGFNKMRVYMKDKPHKWGTKLFMLCCGTMVYCIRFVEKCAQSLSGVRTLF